MKFISKHALLPKDNTLLNNVDEAAERLFHKLIQIDLNILNISEYNKKYLSKYFSALASILRTYCDILSCSVAFSNTPLKDFVLIDYGGGSGMLSLLAKELGIGKVLYNDIYEISCQDARTVARAINNEADFYICGDIDDVISFLKSNSLHCDSITSHDVIEHIYDIEDFFEKISCLSDFPYKIVMATGANPYNPNIRRKLMRKQKEFEYKDQEKKTGYKEGYTSRAYFKVRKEIITNRAPGLTIHEIDQLTKASRGLIESDIQELVDKYLATGNVPQLPAHPTNTCDPYTGNWAEHLMDIKRLQIILAKAGFNVRILSGYYDGSSNKAIKIFIGRILNYIISMLDEKGLFLAPFLTIYAEKK